MMLSGGGSSIEGVALNAASHLASLQSMAQPALDFRCLPSLVSSHAAPGAFTSFPNFISSPSQPPLGSTFMGSAQQVCQVPSQALQHQITGAHGLAAAGPPPTVNLYLQVGGQPAVSQTGVSSHNAATRRRSRTPPRRNKPWQNLSSQQFRDFNSDIYKLFKKEELQGVNPKELAYKFASALSAKPTQEKISSFAELREILLKVFQTGRKSISMSMLRPLLEKDFQRTLDPTIFSAPTLTDLIRDPRLLCDDMKLEKEGDVLVLCMARPTC